MVVKSDGGDPDSGYSDSGGGSGGGGSSGNGDGSSGSRGGGGLYLLFYEGLCERAECHGVCTCCAYLRTVLFVVAVGMRSDECLLSLPVPGLVLKVVLS